MNGTAFRRLIWKEYRLQRALWIAMALLNAMLLFLFHVFALNSTERFYWQFSIGLALPAFYCLGCGATLFAGEREEGTYEFQRSLPVGAKTVFAAKFTFAFVSAAAMFALVGLALMFLHPGVVVNPVEIMHRYAVALAKRMPLLGLEMLLWATFFSLLLRRVLVAAVLGVAVASIHFYFARGWFSHFWGKDLWVAPELVVLTSAVALADLWLGINWFREKRERRGRFAQPILGVGASAWSDHFFRPGRLTTISRLVWQHWRQTSRLAMILVGATMLPLVVICIGRLVMLEPPTNFWQYQTNGANYHFTSTPISFFFGIVPAFVGVSLLGLIAFHPDQWGRGYRFLADRGAPPKYVWLSRQLICWASVAAALPALLAAALFLAPTVIDLINGGELPVARLIAAICIMVIGYVILSVAAGQFCSMFFHSGILAGLFSIILTLVLAGWCGLMWLWQVSWLWSMLPIPLALLLATRLRTRDWLVERNTPRAWLRPILALTIPTVALLTAVPLYRVYQIPLVDPGFSPEEFAREMTPEERTTLEQYEQALQKYKIPREEAFALAIKASRGKSSGKLPNPRALFCIARSLIDSARKLEREGKLDEALERYFAAIRIAGQFRWYYLSANNIERLVYDQLPTWAIRPGQTPERILAAQRQLEQITKNFSIRNAIILRHMPLRRFLEGNLNTIDLFDDPAEERRLQLATYWRCLPWERARSLRLLNSWTRGLLAFSADLDREAASDNRLWRHNVFGPRRPQYRSWITANFFTLENLIQDYLLCDDNEVMSQRAAIETQRRAVRIILALEAWKLQHGSLPKTLDELVGPCLDRLPTDPYTGEPFLYFPDGLQTSFTWCQENKYLVYESRLPSDFEITAHKPFIWSAGTKVLPLEYPGVEKESNLYRYAIIIASGEQDAYYRAASEYEIWASGWPFPIP